MNQPCLKLGGIYGLNRRFDSGTILGSSFSAFSTKEKFYEAVMIKLTFNFMRLFLLWIVGRARFSMIQIGLGLMSRYIKKSVRSSNINPEQRQRELNDISSTLRLIVGD